MTDVDDRFISALKDLVLLLERDPMGMVIGGIAVAAVGYPRATTDIDATVLVPLDQLASFQKQSAERWIVPRIEGALEFARSHHVLLMRHLPSNIDIDISLAALPFEKEAILNRQVVRFEEMSLFVPRVEDLLVYKMVASRPQDIRDVESLLFRHFSKLDLDRVRREVRAFADVLEQPGMSVELERLINATKG